MKDASSKNKVIDIASNRSQKKGIGGFLEVRLRKFRTIGFLCMLAPMIFLYAASLGLALTPGVLLFQLTAEWTSQSSLIMKSLSTALAIGSGYLLYGFSLIFITALFNAPFLFMIRTGKFSWYSLEVIPWYYHNALTYLVRYTFLDLITPTPLNILYFRMMGMKIGKGSVINTTNISDPCFIEIGEYVTIGGSAHIFAHYGMKGILIINRVQIGNRVTIGLKASIMGQTVIGDDVTIAPHAVVLPKSKIFRQKAS